MRELAGVSPPDTDLCAATTEYVERVAPPFLLHHVLRSYVYAHWIGRDRGLSYDAEALYVATVLHDLGLTSLAGVQARFELEGADLAREFLAARGMSEPRLELVWDAIALHTTAEIPLRKSPEIMLCHLGIGADIRGLPPALAARMPTRELLEELPWLGLDDALLDALVGLYRKSPAAAGSHAVADACERRVAGFRRFSLCDILLERARRDVVPASSPSGALSPPEASDR
ncbi:MAG TPA: HD domain-containing protein [Polyangiaceae bacterium]|nr:HD domain-containing protein [Polyangiaceae bacterium]